MVHVRICTPHMHCELRNLAFPPLPIGGNRRLPYRETRDIPFISKTIIEWAEQNSWAYSITPACGSDEKPGWFAHRVPGECPRALAKPRGYKGHWPRREWLAIYNHKKYKPHIVIPASGIRL